MRDGAPPAARTPQQTAARPDAKRRDEPDGHAADDTGARTRTAADAITDERTRIDELDARIISLVRERVSVSGRIQRERVSSGGRRVNLAREMEILSHYRDALGRPGTSLAMTLLELSRGRC
ncbi:chorismate mutase [Streptomyces oceani]|uniref:Chorismate mutase n=1 Tax=Streptomyces oceani TaxID=1075402 RepID=A0A1E7KIB7_9ACTN|nr:chorismate mutase [Streptomyces oceani]OEV03594.1 chorismate mutase [Streptomyces oceani]